MARSVFYSFHYQKDITRVMAVRNRLVTFKCFLRASFLRENEKKLAYKNTREIRLNKSVGVLL